MIKQLFKDIVTGYKLLKLVKTTPYLQQWQKDKLLEEAK